MNIAIYGAGAMGTVLGAYITKAGFEIDLINRNKAHVNALKTKGAHINGTITFTQKVSALTPDEMTKEYDIIFLMTKQKYNEEIVVFLNDYLAIDGVLVTLQNGLPEPLIASIIGDNRVIGGTMSWGATFHGKGVVELTSSPMYDSLTFSIGAYTTVNQQHFETVLTLLRTMGHVTVEENFLGARWAKLTINAAFSGLSVVTGETFGVIAKNKKSRKIALEIIKECIEVAHANDIKIEPLQGHDIVKLMDYHNWFKKQLSLFIIPIAMKKHKHIRSGMLRDLRLNRETEVDYINGVVCDYGKRKQIKTPINDQIVQIVKQIEQKEYQPHFNNLDKIKLISN